MKRLFWVSLILLVAVSFACAERWYEPPGGVATKVNDSDKLVIEQSGVTRAITRGKLLEGVVRGADKTPVFTAYTSSHNRIFAQYTSTHQSGVFTDTQTIRVADVISRGPVIDVRHPSFSGGAKCDGTTDDTAVWNAAIAYAAANQVRTIQFAGRTKITSTLSVPFRGLTIIGQRGARPETEGGSSIDYYGTGAAIEIGSAETSSVCNVASVARSGNTVTVNTVNAHPYVAGDRIRLAGVADASFNGESFQLTAATATTMTFLQTAADAASTGGKVDLSYESTNYALGAYGGKQGFRMENVELRYLGTANSTGEHGTYGTGTVGIRDWRGGDVVLNHVRFEHFEYGFYGINSDLDIFSDVQGSYNKTAIYLGPRSDQFTMTGGYLLLNDTALNLDDVNGATINAVSFVDNGSLASPPVIVGAAGWASTTSSVVFDHCWFEHFDASTDGVNAFIAFGAGTDTATSIGLRLLSPHMLVHPSGQYPHISHLVNINHGDNVVVSNPDGGVGNLDAVFSFSGSTSPVNVLLEQYTGDTVTLYENNGTGNPKVQKVQMSNNAMRWTAPQGDSSLMVTANASNAASLYFRKGTDTATANQWQITNDGGNTFRLYDAAGVGRLIMGQSGNVVMNSTGGNAVNFNQSTGSGTAGVAFYSGGSTPAQVAAISGAGIIQAGGGSANHAICWKADGKTLGYCSAVVASDGTCGTCN